MIYTSVVPIFLVQFPLRRDCTHREEIIYPIHSSVSLENFRYPWECRLYHCLLPENFFVWKALIFHTFCKHLVYAAVRTAVRQDPIFIILGDLWLHFVLVVYKLLITEFKERWADILRALQSNEVTSHGRTLTRYKSSFRAFHMISHKLRPRYIGLMHRATLRGETHY